MKKYLLFILILLCGLYSTAKGNGELKMESSIPIKSILNEDGSINCRSGKHGSLDFSGYNIVIDEARGPIALSESAMAANNPPTWSTLDNGLADTDLCKDIVIDENQNVYVITELVNYTTGVFEDQVRKWDGTSWTTIGTTNNYLSTIALDGNNDNIYVGGSFSTINSIYLGSNIAKWDGASWSAVGNGVGGTCYVIEINGNGDIYAGGRFTSAGGIAANNIAKWDGTSWSALGAGLTGNLGICNVIEIDGSGDLYAGGYFTHAGGLSASRIAKWDGTSWSTLGSGLSGTCHDIEIDGNGDLYAGGSFTQAGGLSASRIAKWDGTSWSTLGSGLYDTCLAIEIDGFGNLNAGGYFTQAGTIQAKHFAKWGQVNFSITSKAFYDSNQNNTLDLGEAEYTQGSIVLNFGPPTSRTLRIGSNSTYGFNDSVRVDFAFDLYRPLYYNATLSKNYTEFQNGRLDTVCIAVQAIPNLKDLVVHLTPVLGRSGAVRPGFISEYNIRIENVGTENMPSPVLIVSLDPHQTFQSATLTPVSTLANNIEWQLPPMSSLAIHDFTLVVVNDVVPNLNGGDIVNNTATIYPVIGDQTPLDNVFNIKQTVRNAYDPNDKNESHNGIISTQQATDQDWLNYLIRFQNTGNDTAFTIIVRDELDDNLDGNTLQMINSSHNYQVNLLNGKFLAWQFNEIDLVDSNTSEPLSHGFIQYRIKPIAGLVLNDMIENSASIYFDYNPPIITNTHVTTVSDDLNCSTCKDNTLHFDGIDDYVQASSPLSGNSDYTIEAWFYSENTGGTAGYNRIIGWQNFEMELADVSGELQFYDGMAWNNTGVNIRDAQWHHVAVTRDRENYKVYVDGNLELDYQRNNTLNLSGFFRLGSRYNLFNEMWKGRIDDVRMWDHARSADKIMAKRYCSLAGAADGLVLYYSFDQGIAAGNNVSETTLVDITDGAQNGTLNAFTLMGASSNYVISDALDENYCLEGSLNILQDHVLVYEDINCAYQTSSNYTTIEIDYGDGNTTILSSSAGFETHDYVIPGIYNVALLLDGKCVASQQILVETCEWQAYTEDFNSGVFDQYHGSCTFVHPSPKTAYLDPIATSLVDHKTRFINYQAYGVLANDVIYDVLTQNRTTNGGLSPNQTELVLVGRNGQVAVTFANALASTQITAPGVNSSSISSLNINTTNWHTLAIKITNEKDIDLIVDNSVVHSFTMSIPLGEVVGLEVNYHGAGTADLIQLSKSPNTLGDYLIENFVSCEQNCPCVYNRHIDYPELTHEVRTYAAANLISGDDLINADAIIVYDAGSAVELQEGFHANLGAEFDVKIDGCPMYCNSTNPLFDFDFLQPYVGNPLYTITHCKWNGQSVFSITYCNSSNGTDSYFYDCTGHLICHALSPSDPCFTMFNFTNCEVLQGC